MSGENKNLVGEADEVSSKDRRRSYRLNKVLGATLVSGDGTANYTRLFVIDISQTGFRATDHQTLAEGDYQISIALAKDEGPFESGMKVVWVKELTVSGMFQFGCEFVNTTPEQAQRLADFLEREMNRMRAAGVGRLGL